jgi:hypothetical protein
MQAMGPNWVTVEAAAKTVDVGAATLREWCREGVVESFREGRTGYFVRLHDVREHIYTIRGRPQTSLATLIASNARSSGHASGSLISQLQGIISRRYDS